MGDLLDEKDTRTVHAGRTFRAAIGVLRALADTVGTPAQRVCVDAFESLVTEPSDGGVAVVDAMQLQKTTGFMPKTLDAHMQPFVRLDILEFCTTTVAVAVDTPKGKRRKRRTPAAWRIDPIRVYYATQTRLATLCDVVPPSTPAPTLATPDDAVLIPCINCGDTSTDVLAVAALDEGEELTCRKCGKPISTKVQTTPVPAAAAAAPDAGLQPMHALNTFRRNLSPTLMALAKALNDRTHALDALVDHAELYRMRATRIDDDTKRQRDKETQQIKAAKEKANPLSYDVHGEPGGVQGWQVKVPEVTKKPRVDPDYQWKPSASPPVDDPVAVPTAPSGLGNVTVRSGGNIVSLAAVTQADVDGMSETELQLYERACDVYARDIELV